MLGQQLPTKESSACLQVESDQPAMSGSSGSGKRYLRIGLTGLALVGVAAWAAFRHDSTSQPSAVDRTLAYMPVPARNAGGLRSRSSGVRPYVLQRTHPVYVGMNGGKGFGGGEATRDPEPTLYDPNDPNWKKTAIHKAESFEEYMAKRNAAGSAPAYVPQAAASPAMPNPPAAAAAPVAHAAPISSEDAAKAAWLANNKPEWERPRSAATPAMPHAPRTAATSEDAAKAAWMARQDFTPWGQGDSASAPRGAAATQPTAASDYFGLPTTPEEATKSVAAAKAAWLANQDFPVWGQGHGASTNSEEAAKAAWLARNDMQHAGMHR